MTGYRARPVPHARRGPHPRRAAGRLASLPRCQAPGGLHRVAGDPPGARTARSTRAGQYRTASREIGGLMGESPAGHVPVMVDTVTALLAPALEREGAVLLDATLGRAGHARALLAAFPGLILIGVDADVTAIERSRELLSRYAGPGNARACLLRRHPRHRAHRRPGQRAGHPLRPRGVVPPAGRPRARLRVFLRRTAGHADGPDPGADRRRGGQPLPGRGTGPRAP